MNHLPQILWYMAFPLTIIVSYFAVLKGLKWFEKTNNKSEETE